MPYNIGDRVVPTDQNTIKHLFGGTPVVGTVEAETHGVYTVKFPYPNGITLRLREDQVAPANGSSGARMGYQNFDVSLSQDIDTALDMVKEGVNPGEAHNFLTRAQDTKAQIILEKMRSLERIGGFTPPEKLRSEMDVLNAKLEALKSQGAAGHDTIEQMARTGRPMRQNLGYQNYGYQQVATTSVQQMQQEFRDKWTRAGASPNLIDKALKLAEDWTRSLAEFAAPNDEDLQNRVYANIYPRALNTVADHWINAFIGFVRGTEMMGQYFRGPAFVTGAP